MPMGKLDFLLGYALAFGLVAIVQAVLAVAVCVRAARPRRARAGVAASAWSASLDALLGTSLGLCGQRLRADGVPGRAVPPAVRASRSCCCAGSSGRATSCRPCCTGSRNVLPLTYAVDAMIQLTRGTPTSEVWRDLLVVAASRSARSSSAPRPCAAVRPERREHASTSSDGCRRRVPSLPCRKANRTTDLRGTRWIST